MSDMQMGKWANGQIAGAKSYAQPDIGNTQYAVRTGLFALCALLLVLCLAGCSARDGVLERIRGAGV
ncbi:MAG: hypothetical protein JXA89_25400, partial [Anaerolineae bacterium]|nr:hypothetical protein [Anaerolineae bacterium]